MEQVKMTFTDGQWRLIKRHSTSDSEKNAAIVRALIAAYFEERGISWPEDLTPLGGDRGGGRKKTVRG